MSEQKIKSKKSNDARNRVMRLLNLLLEDSRKEAMRYFLKISRTRSLAEKRVYKARLLTFFCQKLSKDNRKKFCKEMRTLIRML